MAEIKNYKKPIIVCTTFVAIIAVLFGISLKISNSKSDDKSVERYGFLTILPPALSIILAFATKETISSLLAGVFLGEFIASVDNLNIFKSLFKSFIALCFEIVNSLADIWNSGVFLLLLFICGITHLISRMGGGQAIAKALSKFANTPRKSQIITELLGILIFIDEFPSTLITGSIMGPVMDKLHISREKLAFIIDSTGSPIAGISIISTYIGLEISLLVDAFKSIDIEINGLSTFIKTIPFRYYNILILIFVAMNGLTLYEFGPMRKVEQEARNRVLNVNPNDPTADDDEAQNEYEIKPLEGVKTTIWSAIIPIVSLIIGSLVSFYYSGYTAIMGGEDKELANFVSNSPVSGKAIFEIMANSDSSAALFQATLFASMVSIAIAILVRIPLDKAINEWVNGMKSNIYICIILLFSWSLGGIVKTIGTPDYLKEALKNSIPQFILPTVIYVICSIVSFATGTSFGTMGIIMPLAVPLAWAIHPDMDYTIICSSCVLTGAIFGDHCSPISDSTIVSSVAAGCNHIMHVKTQIYYSIYVSLICILICYIPVGFGIYWYFTIPVAIVVMYIGLRLLGKKVTVPTKSTESTESIESIEPNKEDKE